MPPSKPTYSKNTNGRYKPGYLLSGTFLRKGITLAAPSEHRQTHFSWHNKTLTDLVIRRRAEDFCSPNIAGLESMRVILDD